MNDIFNPFSSFIIVYIDDVLVFSKTIEQHFKHLQTFLNLVIRNGLVIYEHKICLFQTKIRFLGHNLDQGTIKLIDRAIEFATQFPDEILEKTRLQRFLGSLNYVSDHLKDIRILAKPLYQRLKKNPPK